LGMRISFGNTLLAQRNMLLQQALLQKNLARLSSGLRINTAADDPAGLAISEQLRANISGANALATNVSRATNLVQTAEGALAEINTQLTEIRGLVVQAGNRAALGDGGVQAIQGQIENAIGSINRIAATTELAGRPLLNGTFTDEQFAIAEGDPATLSIPNLAPSELGRGFSNASGFTSLADIDVTTLQGAADAFRIVDAAIEEVTGVRAELGAFQTNTLETTARSLQISRENLMSSMSSIRDADFAEEAGESVLAQIRLQAGILARNISNRNTGLILDLLA
jgi:flagellin